MNKFIASIIIGSGLFGCAKVEPGYVGIEVNQYGTQKGVADFPLQTGRVWYNPITTDVYKFPTFRQNVIWTKDGEDESITFNSTEGAILNADVAISYSINAEQVPHIFVEFRKGIEDITHIYLRSEVRDMINRHASEIKTIEIFGVGKQKLLDEVTIGLNERLGHLGFKFELVSFVGAPRADNSVMNSINATIEATQRAIEAQNKIVQATAEAEQRVQTAEGEATSIKMIANAQAEANNTINKSLTPELIRYKAIEKWSGAPPQVIGSDFSTLISLENK